ncbi:hypothetical protein [Nocardioides convexus]|uniref:hypothetical protein n=1 Tax=Nocardioides convexus TaxID=2712224 RepID=UPI0024188E20|nr:hypothetical protein [Nocardioides convexus]
MTDRLAVLIDADNTSHRYVGDLLAEPGEVRPADRQACLRRLDRRRAARLEGQAQPARDQPGADLRLHRRQELHRLGADHRRDGPALLRQRRRLRDRVQRQRLHPAGDAAARVRQDGVRRRALQHPDRAAGGVRPVHPARVCSTPPPRSPPGPTTSAPPSRPPCRTCRACSPAPSTTPPTTRGGSRWGR